MDSSWLVLLAFPAPRADMVAPWLKFYTYTWTIPPGSQSRALGIIFCRISLFNACMVHFFLQLCDSVNLRSLLCDDQESLTLVLCTGSLKGGGKETFLS